MKLLGRKSRAKGRGNDTDSSRFHSLILRKEVSFLIPTSTVDTKPVWKWLIQHCREINIPHGTIKSFGRGV